MRNLVDPELFNKYDRLLLQTSLDTMSDITFCPRTICQSPVLMEKETTLAICPACNFVFCALCRLVYHGLSPCKLKAGKYIHLMTKDNITQSLYLEASSIHRGWFSYCRQLGFYLGFLQIHELYLSMYFLTGSVNNAQASDQCAMGLIPSVAHVMVCIWIIPQFPLSVGWF